MKRSDVPDFAVAGLTFQGWVVGDGANEATVLAVRYEWRTEDDRCRVGRNVGNAMCWANVDGRQIGTHFQHLRQAMEACARSLERKIEKAA